MQFQSWSLICHENLVSEKKRFLPWADIFYCNLVKVLYLYPFPVKNWKAKIRQFKMSFFREWVPNGSNYFSFFENGPEYTALILRQKKVLIRSSGSDICYELN